MNTMPCSNTAALQQHEASQDISREEEAAQLANDAERIRVRAMNIAGSDSFASDIVCNMADEWFQAIGEMSVKYDDDFFTYASIGKKIATNIREAAIRQARKELGL